MNKDKINSTIRYVIKWVEYVAKMANIFIDILANNPVPKREENETKTK